MKKNISFKTTFHNKEAEITALYWPATKGCWYRKNGDPGFPDEPAEVEILTMVIDGINYNVDSLTEDEVFELHNIALEEAEQEPDEPPKDDERDWK